MKTVLYIVLFIIVHLSHLTDSIGQNYQSVKSGQIPCFQEDWFKDLRFLRIDSVDVQTDSILFPFHNIEEVDPDECYDIKGASWMGKKIIIGNDGRNLFFNKNADTIKINTQAYLGHKWIAFRADQKIIQAEITKHDTLSFLGLTDSVKNISFQVYNTMMVPINHGLNDMELILSKNHGLIRTFNFQLFPDYHYDDIYRQDFAEYELVGFSNPLLGIQNLTWFDVYNHQPGDEIHTKYRSTNYGPSVPIGYYLYIKQINRYLKEPIICQIRLPIK